MKPILTYEPGSDTIRQMPQNYLVAHKEHGRWICDSDMAADYELCVRVFKAVHSSYDARYGSGLFLLSLVTPNK